MGKDSVTSQFLLAECQRTFGFLSSQFSFSEPRSFRHDNVLEIVFLKSGIAIECVYDARDVDLELYVSRLINGKRPGVFRVDEKTGRVVRERLTVLLETQGMRDIKFDPLPGDPMKVGEQEYTRRALEAYARLLMAHGGSILSGQDDVFENLKP